MKKSFELSLPTPCSEKWGNMLPTNQGGFCSHCSKEVIDFTKWSESQIEDYFKKGNSNTCGRFRKDQLKTYSISGGPAFRNRFLPLSVLGISLLAISARAEFSGKRPIPMENVCQDTPGNTEIASADTIRVKTISGIVRDVTDQSPLPGVNVQLRGTTMGTTTDAEGKFILKIPEPGKSDVLVFSFIGFETKEISVNESDEFLVTLEMEAIVLGEPMSVVAGGVRVRRWAPRSIWWRIKNIFR